MSPVFVFCFFFNCDAFLQTPAKCLATALIPRTGHFMCLFYAAHYKCVMATAAQLPLTQSVGLHTATKQPPMAGDDFPRNFIRHIGY